MPAPAAPAAAAAARPQAAAGGWVFALMAVVAVVMLYPFYYMLDNAFRTQKQFDQQSGHSLVPGPSCSASCPWAGRLLNSCSICVASIVIILIVSTTRRVRVRQAPLPRQRHGLPAAWSPR